MDELARMPVPTETLASDGTTNVYVVGTDGAILVDPAARTPALDREVERRGVDKVVVTHTHPDHVGAVAHYAGTTDATVRAAVERREALAVASPTRSLFSELIRPALLCSVLLCSALLSSTPFSSALPCSPSFRSVRGPTLRSASAPRVRRCGRIHRARSSRPV